MYEKLRCPICLRRRAPRLFRELSSCRHVVCKPCLLLDMRIRILFRSRAFSCPLCSVPMHTNDVAALLGQGEALDKYEKYKLKQALLQDPDTRWCPAPKCEYAVIARNCAACPILKCQNPKCGMLFCYKCGAEWHEGIRCKGDYQSTNVRIDDDDDDDDYAFDDEFMSSLMVGYETSGFVMRDLFLFFTAPLVVLVFVLIGAVTTIFMAPIGFTTVLKKKFKKSNCCARFLVISIGVTLFVIVFDLYLIPLLAIIMYIPILILVYIGVISSLFRAVSESSCHLK